MHSKNINKVTIVPGITHLSALSIIIIIISDSVEDFSLTTSNNIGFIDKFSEKPVQKKEIINKFVFFYFLKTFIMELVLKLN